MHRRRLGGYREAIDGGDRDRQVHLKGGVGYSFINREIDSWSQPGFLCDENADRHSRAAMRQLVGEMF